MASDLRWGRRMIVRRGKVKLPVIASAWALAFMAAGLPASAEIMIGVPAPLSGPMAWIGEESAVAAEIAVAGLNANGGVLGEQLRVVRVDDHCDADQAVAAARSSSPRASTSWWAISARPRQSRRLGSMLTPES